MAIWNCHKDGATEAPPKKQQSFIKPTVEEIRQYCCDRNNGIDAEHFFDYYQANGWKVGKNPMKDWRASIRTWERNDKQKKQPIDSTEQKKLEELREKYKEGNI